MEHDYHYEDDTDYLYGNLLVSDNYAVKVIKPVWEPFNDSSEQLVSDYLDLLELPKSPARRPKYVTMVASILRAARQVLRENGQHWQSKFERLVPIYIGAATGNDNWSIYPNIGRQIALNTLKAFEESGLITKHAQSGRRLFYTTENGRLAYRPIMTMWEVSEKLNSVERFQSARFVETGRPLVQVNAVETRQTRDNRQRHGDQRSRMSSADSRRKFPDGFTDAEGRVKRLNSYWRKHPLVFPDGSAAACAYRAFSDGRMDVGGRLYGRWTSVSSKDRLGFTIDDEPIISLDIAASQPTLLSGLMGIRFQNISKTTVWHDPYMQLSSLTFEGISSDTSEIERDSLIERNRAISKRIVMEIIGTGNVNKRNPSDKLIDETDVTQEEWDHFKNKLREVIPALECLEPRFDSLGNTSGYINGPAFLMFHESEIMMQTLEALRDEHDVPAYPVHDCLLVKESDFDVSIRVFTQIISDYCKKESGEPITVPITRESNRLPKRTFRGFYDQSINDQLSP